MNDQDTTQVMPPADPPPEPQKPQAASALALGPDARRCRRRARRLLPSRPGDLPDWLRGDPLLRRARRAGLPGDDDLRPVRAVGRDGAVQRTENVRTRPAPDRRRDRRHDRALRDGHRGGVGGSDRQRRSDRDHRDRNRCCPCDRRVQRRRSLADPAGAGPRDPARHRRRGGHRVRRRHRQDHSRSADGPRDSGDGSSSASATSGSTCATSTGTRTA